MIRLLCVICLLSFSQFAAALPFDLPEWASLESKTKPVKDNHQVLLSAPKRVSNALRIEDSKFVDGIRENYLIRIQSPGTSKLAYDLYKGLFQEKGQIQFECSERACGSSNYWANTILNERKLYGRDSDQYYVAGQLKLKGVRYWASVYAVQNGRKQDYVYISLFAGEDSQYEGWLNGLVLESDILPLEYRQFVQDYLKENADAQLWLKASVPSAPSDSFETLKKQTDEKVLAFRKDLAEKNDLPAKRIKIFSAGGLGAAESVVDSKTVYQLYLFQP